MFIADSSRFFSLWQLRKYRIENNEKILGSALACAQSIIANEASGFFGVKKGWLMLSAACVSKYKNVYTCVDFSWLRMKRALLCSSRNALDSIFTLSYRYVHAFLYIYIVGMEWIHLRGIISTVQKTDPSFARTIRVRNCGEADIGFSDLLVSYTTFFLYLCV